MKMLQKYGIDKIVINNDINAAKALILKLDSFGKMIRVLTSMREITMLGYQNEQRFKQL
jgi:hypothetical protein